MHALERARAIEARHAASEAEALRQRRCPPSSEDEDEAIKGVSVNESISLDLSPSELSFAVSPLPNEGFEASAPLVALRRSKSPADARPGRPRAHRRAP